MIKAVIFDFDGVLVESADIKTEAFAELFADYPDHVQEIVEYHRWNMGISRFVKFRYFYKEILKKELLQEEEAVLGERFSKVVLDKVLAAPFVAGAIDFLKKNFQKRMLFITSGTPQAELDGIVRARDLEKYFREIHGSPRKKAEIVNGILSAHDLKAEEAVFVGDAESDLKAAEETGVHFITRKFSGQEGLSQCPFKIEDLSQLEKIINTLEN